MRVAPTVSITEVQRKQLQSWARGRSTPMRLAQRAAIILRAADGMSDYIEQHNRDPKPFIWTAKASDILAKVTKAHSRLNKFPSA